MSEPTREQLTEQIAAMRELLEVIMSARPAGSALNYVGDSYREVMFSSMISVSHSLPSKYADAHDYRRCAAHLREWLADDHKTLKRRGESE